jgi:hypothetical protein
MDYQGYKLLDKIMLVCKDLPAGGNSEVDCYPAYFVDPANAKQLDSARHWARWIEYGPSIKNENGRWTHEYEIDHKPVEFTFDNDGFTLELLDCAGGSSQGGKLSFWNCLVKKDGKTFKIGINSEMLLNLLKDADFNKGVCQSSLIFITQKGRVGLTVEGSDTYKQCIADRDLKKKFSTDTTSKYQFGDIIKTATLTEVYLGSVKQYYTFDIGRNADKYYYIRPNLRECTLIKHAKPTTQYLFEGLYNENKKVSAFVEQYKSYTYSYPDFRNSRPKRIVEGKINVDMTEEDFYKELLNKVYDFELHKEIENKERSKYGWTPQEREEDEAFYYFLANGHFGIGTEGFELSEELLNKIKAAGVKYMEE